VQKRNEERKECEEKEKKRKEVKGDQHIKGCGVKNIICFLIPNVDECVKHSSK